MEQQGSEINHRGKRGATAPLPRKFSTILSRLDEFQIQSSGKIHRDFDAILLKFYRVKFKGKKFEYLGIFQRYFTSEATNGLYFAPHYQRRIYISKNPLPHSSLPHQFIYTRKRAIYSIQFTPPTVP